MPGCTRLFEAGILGEGRMSMNILDENFFWAWMENVHLGAALGTTACFVTFFALLIVLGNKDTRAEERTKYTRWIKGSVIVGCLLSAVASLPRAEDIRDVALHRAVTTAVTSENLEVITASVSRMVVRTECAVFGCEKK